MKELVARIEFLLVTMVIVASCLLIPVAKPRLDVRQSAISLFDNFARLRGDCAADLSKDKPGIATYAAVLDTYSRRLYSEEASSSPKERWSLISALPISVLLELQAGLQPAWIGYHDMWADPENDYEQCPKYLAAIETSTNELLTAYYYTGAEDPAKTPLVDLDSKFNASMKVPYIDEAFSFAVVLRIVFAVVCFSMVYIIILLGSLRGMKRQSSLLDYGPLIFCQPGSTAVVLGTLWVFMPSVMFVYLLWAQIAHGAEGISFALIVLVCTLWLVLDAYRFRREVLGAGPNPGPQPDGTAGAAPRG